MHKLKYIIIAVILMALIGIWYTYTEFHRKHEDLSSIKSDIEISSTDLVKAFVINEDSANKLYLDKTIAVRGKIKSIVKLDGLYTIVLGTDVEESGVSCGMDLNHNEEASKMKEGTEVVMKGVCTGHLMDVELVRCVIEK